MSKYITGGKLNSSDSTICLNHWIKRFSRSLLKRAYIKLFSILPDFRLHNNNIKKGIFSNLLSLNYYGRVK